MADSISPTLLDDSDETEESSPLPFRSGNRAEYLAQYMLSKFGVSVPIMRQEDHGFDFYCSIDVAKEGVLPDFRHAFYVQVKLGEPKPVKVGGMTTSGEWRSPQVHWLLNLDLPLLLGFVDIQQHTLKLYQTSARWLLYYKAIDSAPPMQISLEPSVSVSAPTFKPSKSAAAKKVSGHDGQHWHVSLGPALVEINLADLDAEAKVLKVKEKLGEYVSLERINISHRELRSQFASWVCSVDWNNKPFQRAFVMEEEKFPPSKSVEFYRECAPYLASLIFRLKASGDTVEFVKAVELFRSLEPRLRLPPDLKRVLEKAITEGFTSGIATMRCGFLCTLQRRSSRLEKPPDTPIPVAEA
jgi:hypothetical protein